MMIMRSRLVSTAPLARARALHSSAAARAAIPRVTPSAAAAKANIQPATQSASLASGVLLNTHRNWRNETVVTLKAELKRRGLSQQGNKAALVDRLRDAEASASLVPPTPVSAPTSPRRLSTSSSAQAAPSAPVHAAPSAPARAAPTSRTLFPEAHHVSSPAGDHDVETPPTPEVRPVTPATRTSAPGIPIKPNTVGRTFFDVKFPDPPVEKEIPQIIPTVPSNFTIPKRAAPSIPKPSEPRVVTMASAATLPGGGPVSPAVDVADSYALEFDDPSVLAIDQHVDNAMAAASNAISNLVEVNLPPAPTAEESTYVVNSEPLDDEERRGAWLLVGGIAAVLVAAGISHRRGSKKEAAPKEAKAAGKKE